MKHVANNIYFSFNDATESINQIKTLANDDKVHKRVIKIMTFFSLG